MKNLTILSFSLGIFLLLVNPAFSLELASGRDIPANKAGPPPDIPEYVIHANDILEIFVWQEDQLSRKVLVRPDGRISFPLVQDMLASGLTPTQLKEQIEIELTKFLDAPSVTVIVDQIQHYKVYVVGQVQQPGSFTSEKPVSVLQALTLAGGFQEFANKSSITVVRKSSAEHLVFEFNYDDVIKGKKTHQNITLLPGDVVVVP